jgi:N-dimethylarginine dimethylaminohydrolase
MRTTILLRTWVNDDRHTQMMVGDEVMIGDFTSKRTGTEGCQHIIHAFDGDALTVTLRTVGYNGTVVIHHNELNPGYAFFRKI